MAQHLEQALAMAYILSTAAQDDVLPERTLWRYGDVLHGEIRAALNLWNQHNGVVNT